MKRASNVPVLITCVFCSVYTFGGEEAQTPIKLALSAAKQNRDEVNRALEECPAEQKKAMEFLVSNMPERDLQELTADFLLENVSLAYSAWNDSPWKSSVPEDIFLNNILPYASINENRDNWRKDFRDRFLPMVKDAKSSGEAAVILNQKIFPLLSVKYSTKRRRADQGPYESIETGLASCTGLSILLIDACRSVGVPARFVGTPLWSDRSGNHSWVEVWDDGWHFTGAAEPAGDDLDKAWFVGRCATAQRDHRLHAIYAVSFKRTPLKFPLVWNRQLDYVRAVNVTDRYTKQSEPLREGHVYAMFRVVDKKTQERASAEIQILNLDGKELFTGITKDERFDANDHLTFVLPQDTQFRIRIKGEEREFQTAKIENDRQLFTFIIE